MALTLNRKTYPTIVKPVGSREEVEKLDPKLLFRVATCSKRVNGENMGCHVWDREVGSSCEFPWKGQGPQFVACGLHKGEGDSKVVVCHCQDAVILKDQIELNDGYVEFLGCSGTVIDMDGSVRKHPKVDPSCPECLKGNCNAHEDSSFKHTVPPFPPAAQHKDLKRFAKRAWLRGKNREEGDARKRAELYENRPSLAPGREPEHEPEAELAGGGAGNLGQRGRRKNTPTAAEPE